MTILDDAARAVEEREAVYGPPREHFARTAQLWTAYLGIPVADGDVPMLFALDKISRLARTPGHRDSLTDIAGYARTIEMLTEGAND